MRSLPALALLGLTAVVACGGAPSGGGAGAPLGPEAGKGQPGGKVPTKGARDSAVATAKVFDAHGVAAVCAPPREDCPAEPIEREFLDNCRLGGFQLRKCGCTTRCSGDVSAAARFYDASGAAKECATARDECTPPQASAAFQDACTERGHRLAVCGCEWLCSGNPTK